MPSIFFSSSSPPSIHSLSHFFLFFALFCIFNNFYPKKKFLGLRGVFFRVFVFRVIFSKFFVGGFQAFSLSPPPPLLSRCPSSSKMGNQQTSQADSTNFFFSSPFSSTETFGGASPLCIPHLSSYDFYEDEEGGADDSPRTPEFGGVRRRCNAKIETKTPGEQTSSLSDR